jgi:hypothetical protein
VHAGDVVQVGFAYRCGGSIPSLEASIRTELVARFVDEALQEKAGAAEFA